MSKEIKKHCVKWGVNPPFLSRWILTSVILVSSVIIRVFMALGSAKISQWILRSESSKFWSSTFSRRNLPNYIYEYHTFKMTGSYRPHFFFSGFCALLEHKATFSLDVFNQKTLDFNRISIWKWLPQKMERYLTKDCNSDSVIQSHQDVSALSSGPSHWGIFDPQACHVRITKQQHCILSQLHRREKEVAGGKKSKKNQANKTLLPFLSPFIKKEKHFLESSKPEMARTESCS